MNAAKPLTYRPARELLLTFAADIIEDAGVDLLLDDRKLSAKEVEAVEKARTAIVLMLRELAKPEKLRQRYRS